MIVLPTVAPEPLLEVLRLSEHQGECAIQAVKTQLANHEKRRNTRSLTVQDGGESGVPSLFDAAAKRLAYCIRGDVEEDEAFLKALESLPQNVLGRITPMLDIPYDILCRLRQVVEGGDSDDVDEWVLRNEVWLRESPICYEEDVQAPPSKRFRWDNDIHEQYSRRFDWQRGMVRLSTQADIVFSGSQLTDTCRIITRPTSLPGLKFLDGKRPPTIRIQPSVELFAKTFESMTGGLLKGLNWDHVLVAGGIVLGTLLCTEDEETTNTVEQWEDSDVDLYIYGLGPVEANKKIEDIFEVFKSNLPQDAPVLVVRNSKTITFYSKYPLRRIQVVLKLVDSPKAVLLNFDLDICAIGWDGEEVWMIPRAARALETGYTVFTMDLINGHYLGDRRATQERRVFKYANRGYGIRILPSYLNELEVIMEAPSSGVYFDATTPDDEDDADDEDDYATPRSIDDVVRNARHWTARWVTKLKYYEIDRVNRYRWSNRVSDSYVPTISHDSLQVRSQDTADPQRRSALSGLGLFVRHVALWEHELAGNVIIEKDSWASSFYGAKYATYLGMEYSDIPDYSWDDTFTIEGFIVCLAQFNKWEITQTRPRGSEPHHTWDGPSHTQRVTYAPTAQEVLKPVHDICLPVRLPQSFVDFADDAIREALRGAGLPLYTEHVLVPSFKDEDARLEDSDSNSDSNSNSDSDSDSDSSLRLLVWRMTTITMWQQLSRTIDEVHEALWAFHHANDGVGVVPRRICDALLFSSLGRRAVRMTTQDEFGAFAQWVVRIPSKFEDMHKSN